MSNEQVNNEQETARENTEAPKITLDDIVTMQKIIALASSRGSFRAEEMSAVGRTYDRISAFVSHNVPEEDNEKTDSPDPEEG